MLSYSRLLGLLKIFVSYVATLQAFKLVSIPFPPTMKALLQVAEAVAMGSPSGGNTLPCSLSNVAHARTTELVVTDRIYSDLMQ